jgi:glycosyltransferase involved in cell wall biosynthesis
MSVYYKETSQNFNRAMQSIWDEQTVKPNEIVLIQDGKLTDELYRVISEWKNKLSSVLKLILLEENSGLASALNEGVIRITNDYIVRMDTDDISTPQRFERQLDFMNKNTDIDVCGTYIKEFGDRIEYSKVVTYPLTHNAMLNFFKKRNPIAHPSAFFRRSFFEKSGLYEVNGHISNEDTLMWMSGFSSNCKFANVDFIGVEMQVGRDFFGRRGGFKKMTSDFKNRLTVNKRLHFGLVAYFYAIAVAIVNIMPPTLKKIAYKYLRG